MPTDSPLRDEGPTGFTRDENGELRMPPLKDIHLHFAADPDRPGWQIATPCIIEHEGD